MMLAAPRADSELGNGGCCEGHVVDHSIRLRGVAADPSSIDEGQTEDSEGPHGQ